MYLSNIQHQSTVVLCFSTIKLKRLSIATFAHKVQNNSKSPVHLVDFHNHSRSLAFRNDLRSSRHTPCAVFPPSLLWPSVSVDSSLSVPSARKISSRSSLTRSVLETWLALLQEQWLVGCLSHCGLLWWKHGLLCNRSSGW